MSNPLPERASLEQLRKQAKELRRSGVTASLSEAQLVLARTYGYSSWPRLVLELQQRRLQQIIRDGDIEELKKLLAKSRRLASAPFANGSFPLHDAAECNDPAMIRLLVESGASLKPRYSASSHTPLSWAVTCWSADAAMALVELGDEPDLFCAAGLGLLDKVRQFWDGERLKPGASKTGSSHFSESGERLPCPPESDRDVVSDALYIACRNGRIEVARWLLDHGADPNWKGFIEANCLAWAELSGNRELCALLRSRGASDTDEDAEFGATPRIFPIMILAGWGFQGPLSRALAASPELVHARAGCGSPLHAVAMNGHVASARILIAAGADPKALNPSGRTPADIARERGYTELALFLESSTLGGA